MMRFNWVRDYERVDCPGCGRRISAYIPHFGDGSGLRTVKHKAVRLAKRGLGIAKDCPASGRIVVRRDGKWAIDR
jgi:hypothetical protein